MINNDKVEEELRETKQLMEFILGATKTGLDVIDGDYNMVYVDAEWAKIYGDYKGKKCYEYFMDRREACPVCGVRKALKTGKAVVSEEVLVKEGSRPIQVTTIPFKSEKGEQLVAEVNVDISELKRSQDTMVQSEKLASLGRLVSEIAHEVNNPLMVISGNAQILLMSENLDPEVKSVLEIIMGQCQKTKNIMCSILKFAKPSKGEMKVINIADSIDEAAGIIEKQLEAVNVSIERDYPEKKVLVQVDNQSMQEVFMNLLNNAIEAMPGGGIITIKVSADRDRVKIDFKDTGCGMSEEVKKRAFEPFFTTKEKGTGLGLPICYGIVKTHNGELRFDSRLNEGTTATILLPLEK
jgi:signal transduction histidine kinase